MAVGTNITKTRTDFLMFFTTLTSSAFTHSKTLRFVGLKRRNIMKITPSTNTAQRTNIITMVEPFAGPAAWLCRFQPPHPRVPLQKGSDEGGAKGSYLLLRSGGEKKLITTVNVFFNSIPLFYCYGPQNDGLTPPCAPPMVTPPLLTLLCYRRLFLVGCCV